MPESLQKVQRNFDDLCARFSSQIELVEAYPAIHKSIYAPITSSSRAIPARDRILHCPPPPGCPIKPKPLFVLKPELDQRAALVRLAAAGYDRTGYALKDFMVWACAHDIDDSLLMPLRSDVLEAYLASLASYYSKAVIASRIMQLKRWHAFYDVQWICKDEEFTLILQGAAKLAPYPKLKREPLLVDTLVKIYPFLDMNNSFDRAWWSATTFAHRGCLRSGEFTVPSKDAYDPDLHISIDNISIVSVDGKPCGLKAHLPHDKVNGRNGADVSITALEAGHVACPIAALKVHVETNGIKSGEPLFSYTGARGRSVGKRCVMTKSLWRERLGELLVQAGLPPMSGHTVRIGGATQLLLDGVDPLVVKVVGCWKSDAFELYWRNITAVLARYAAKKPSARAPTTSAPGLMLEELQAVSLASGPLSRFPRSLALPRFRVRRR